MLEVLVALAIAVPALLVLYKQGASALGQTGRADAYAEALSRAESRLEALVDTALQPGERSGEDGGAYRWRTQIAALTTSPIRGNPPRSPYAEGVTLYAVAVRITWPGPERPRMVELHTRRLGPAHEQGP